MPVADAGSFTASSSLAERRVVGGEVFFAVRLLDLLSRNRFERLLGLRKVLLRMCPRQVSRVEVCDVGFCGDDVGRRGSGRRLRLRRRGMPDA
jgi:hypothetical protein